LIKKAQDTVD